MMLDMGTSEIPLDTGQIGVRVKIPDRSFTITKSILAHQLLEESIFSDLFKEFMWAAGDGSVIDYDVTTDLRRFRETQHNRGTLS